MGKLDGKVAVITGATSGMALATSRLFIEEGAYVFVTGPASGEAGRGREVHRPGRHRRAGPDNPFIRPVSEPAVSRDPANAAPTPPPAGRSVSRKPVSNSKSHDWPARRRFVRLTSAVSGVPPGAGAMRIGYAGVSTLEQNLDLQEDALKAAGCEKVYTDRISGMRAARPGLEQALADLRSGDQLVVWKLDRLGRSLKHLIETVTGLSDHEVGFLSLQEAIDTATSGGKLVFHVFGALAEFERDIIRERTFAGLAAARARGRMGGRPCNLDDKKKRHAMTLHADPSNSVKDIYRTLGIFNARLYRYLAEQRGRWSATPAVRRNDGPRSLGDVRLSSKLDGRALFSAPLLILSANSRRRSFGRNLGKLGHAEKANPGLQRPRAEFADSIRCYRNP